MRISNRLKRIRREFRRYYIVPGALFLGILAVNGYILRQTFVTDPPLVRQNATANSVHTAALPDNLLPPQQIKNLVKAQAAKATITKIELKNKNEKLVYVVSLEGNAQLVFDAKTGHKLDGEVPKAKDQKTPPETFTPAIDFASAAEQALSQKQGGVISKITLLAQGTEATYNVHFTDGSIVAVATYEEETPPATSGTDFPQGQPTHSANPQDPSAGASPSTSPDGTETPPTGSGQDPGTVEAGSDSPGF